MHRSAITHLRWVAAAGLAAALGVTGGAALAQPTGPQSAADCSTLHFSLANPAAGDTLLPGGYVVEGFAFDAAATTQQGTGVDRVEFFLNDRDAGGRSLGTANLGEPSTVALPGSQFGAAGFRLDLTLPKQSGDHTLFAYAHSTVTDQEQVLSVPIQVFSETKTEAVSSGALATTGRPTCAPAAQPTQTVLPTSAATVQPTPQTVATTTAATQATPQPTAVVAPAPQVDPLQLVLNNPQSGDELLAGAYTITGAAVDSRATTGAGIDRVEIFLGDRDQGGAILGSVDLQASTASAAQLGAFSIDVDLPHQNAGATLFAYARSSVTGEEMLVTIPVIVGPISTD